MSKLDYTPENPAEELFELVGRIKAFAAYVNSTEYNIERKLCASMLGFELRDEGGEKSAKDNSSDGDSKLD